MLQKYVTFIPGSEKPIKSWKVNVVLEWGNYPSQMKILFLKDSFIRISIIHIADSSHSGKVPRHFMQKT